MVLRGVWLRWCDRFPFGEWPRRPGCASRFPLGKALFLLFLVRLPDEVAVHEQDVEDVPVMPVVDQAAVVQDGAVVPSFLTRRKET